MNNSAIHTTFNMKVNKSKSFKLFIYSIAIISAVMKYFARILNAVAAARQCWGQQRRRW